MRFSAAVEAHWFRSIARDDVPAAEGSYRVAVDPAFPRNRRVMLLEFAHAGGIATIAPDASVLLGLEHGQTIDAEALHRSLDRAGIALNSADALFYLPLGEQARVTKAEAPDSIRVLTQRDAAMFAAFEADAPADDLDEAFVELDHWLVVGAIVDGRLACAASMYPWQDTVLADTGVITLPEHRGQGFARAVVRAIAAHAMRLGYEPQYRCQLDNAPSVALAASAGFERFATWDVVQGGD